MRLFPNVVCNFGSLCGTPEELILISLKMRSVYYSGVTMYAPFRLVVMIFFGAEAEFVGGDDDSLAQRVKCRSLSYAEF